MLRLKGIEKFYKTSTGGVQALKGIDVNFRRSEFVSVLGPSGCGKTTLLNIIGGLDHYTAGEMSIDGINTREYGDRDWDTYRNERIGFVFQSYNLIPQQSIQGNVELALTIAGVDRHERARRAREALDKVGLAGQYGKRPNQLSGGQCQRVAIARALVNEPEILLADEPTGALDTVTSVQIMELIKEIAGDKLVVMVTHNPELARQYSTRIVELLDGRIVGDSDPYTDEECDKDMAQSAEGELAAAGASGEGEKSAEGAPGEGEESAENTAGKAPDKGGESAPAGKAAGRGRDKKAGAGAKKRKSKLSLWTAFGLSARNLRAKLKRTVMVCIAGSIGIIGVASVLAVSTGVQGYIEDMQNDMLSGNPVTVQESGYDLSTITDMMSGGAKQEVLESAVEDGYVNVDAAIDRLVEMADMWGDFTFENEITPQYVEYVKAMPREYYSAMSFDHGVNMSYSVYTDVRTAKGSERLSLYAADATLRALIGQAGHEDVAEALSGTSGLLSLAPDSNEFILSQYDIVNEGGRMPEQKGEIMLVINDESELSDLVLAQLGYYTQEEVLNIVYKATGDKRYDAGKDKTRFSYEELLDKTFTLYFNDDIYSIDGDKITYDPSHGGEGAELKITAVLRPKEGLSFGSLSTGIYYTQALDDEVAEKNSGSALAAFIGENGKKGALSGMMTGTGAVMGSIPVFEIRYEFEGSEFSQTVCVGSEYSLAGTSSYTLSLRDVGGSVLPQTISIYPANFELKDGVTAYLNAWNEEGDLVVGGVTLTAEQRAQITYTDNLSVIISMIGDMIDIVTYALVAFTALSLVVSTVMIAIITYVSVIERVKEIGVIRSLGGRKKDVSRLFNAETFIIGLIAGVIGVVITYIICAVINGVVGAALGIAGIARLPFTTALILIAVSVALTLISGLIPARFAAKKDPVEALRSE